MIDLALLFKNHLDTERVSDDNLNRFGQDHLQRLIANPAGTLYTPLIALTTAAYNGYFNAMAAEGNSARIKESSTITVDELKKQFVKLVAKKEGTISSTWDKGSSDYERFFPHGVDEYHQSTKANIQILMSNWLSACEAYRGQLPANFADQFTVIVNAYEEAREAQLLNIGATDGSRLETATKRDVLEKQLMVNMLTIASHNVGHPEVLEVYFDQSIIRKPSQPRTEGEQPEVPMSGVIAPGESVVAKHGDYDGNTEISLLNNGATVIQAYTANLPTDAVPGSALTLQPGEQVETFASELGASGNLYLMIYNTSETTAGSYEAMIIDG